MTQKADYYDVLGIDRSASDADIKKAYKKKAMKYHPDRNLDNAKQAEAKFKEVREAYAVLSDNQKKAAYDQFGHDMGGHQAGGNPFSGGFGGFDDIFKDIFEGFAGGGQQRSQAQRGGDQLYAMELTLQEAIFGAQRQVTLPTLVQCTDCNGSGAQPGSKPITCPDCGGTGQIRINQGFLSIQQTCPRCKGRGQIIKDPCRSCHGQGRRQSEQRLSVKIPAGVDQGDRIRLQGKGEAGAMGGANGDLYIEFTVKPHPLFTREGKNLICEVPISFTQAALGDEIAIMTLDGKVILKIPKETQSGSLFRLKGKGAPDLSGRAPGDLICKVITETPVKLNNKQRTMLKEFALSLDENHASHQPKTTRLVDAMKQFFKDIMKEG